MSNIILHLTNVYNYNEESVEVTDTNIIELNKCLRCKFPKMNGKVVYHSFKRLFKIRRRQFFSAGKSFQTAIKK